MLALKVDKKIRSAMNGPRESLEDCLDLNYFQENGHVFMFVLSLICAQTIVREASGL